MTRAVRLTRRGRWVLLSGCALVLAGVITGVPLALSAGVFALAVCGSALAWAAVRRHSVSISRMTTPQTSAVGRELRTVAVVTVGRPGFGPALVRNLAPLGGEPDDGREIVRLARPEVLVERTCVPQRRGLLDWPLLGAELPDPLGIAVGIRQAAPSGRTLVFPRTVPLGRRNARVAAGEWSRGPINRRSPGDPGPVPRAYQSGDELRRMHWPATARTGDPMVRADEPQAARTAFIEIDCSPGAYRDPEAFERAVTACASISERLLDEGWSISVRTAQGMPLADPGLLGSQGRDRVMAALADLRADSSGPVVPPPQDSPSGAVIAILGARSRALPSPAINLCTEFVDTGTLIWDGTGPLASVWAAATTQGAVA